MGDKSPDEPQSSKIAGQIAKDVYQQTGGIRSNVFNDLTNFTGGNFDLSQSPMWQPQRNLIEDQYNVAEENILGNLPQGGQLLEALANNDMSRANTLSSLGGQIGQDYLNKAYGLASGVPQQSSNTLSNLGAQQYAAEAGGAQSTAGMLGGLGMGIGSLLAAPATGGASLFAKLLGK